MSQALDANTYRKRVLVPLADRGEDGLPDAFALLDLAPETDDHVLIEERLRLVMGFWRNDRNPKTKGIAGVLLSQQSALRHALLDPAERRALRQRVLAERAAVKAGQSERLDQAIRALVGRFGGVPRSKRPDLLKLASRSGLSEADLDEHLARAKIIEDGSGTDEALAPAIRAQIRQALSELARLRSDPEGARTLYSLLGVRSTSSTPELRARHDEIAARNRQRRADREKTLVGELLTFSRLHLIEGDRSLYANGLVEDVKDALRSEVEVAALVEDHLSSADVESLVRKGVAHGVDADSARDAVSQLAREYHIGLEATRAVDYVTCGRCGALEPDDGRAECRRCAAELYRPCPSCAHRIEAITKVCPHCQLDLRELAEAEQHLVRAQAALSAGALDSARDALVAARVLAPSLDALQVLEEELLEIERANRRAVQEAERAIAERRLVRAKELLGELIARGGGDLEAPGGLSARERLAFVDERLGRAEQLMAAAQSATGTPAEEGHLIRVLTLVSDADAARSRLELIPPAPPTAVSATLAADGEVRVSWSCSSSPGDITYQLVRAPKNEPERVLGRTAECEFIDGTSGAGGLVRYRVSARRGAVSSDVANSDPILITPEVSHLASEGREGEVVLRWRDPAGGQVFVERTEAATAGAATPTRRLRPEPGGYVDTHVRNGTTYEYRVFVEYRDAENKLLRTAGLRARARPRARLSSVRDLALGSPTPGLVELRWQPPRLGSVRVVRLEDRAPAPSPGSPIDPSRLAQLGAVLEESSPGIARDRPPALSVTTYLPVTILDEDAIAGVTVVHLGLEDARDVVVTDGGSELVVSWTWPEGCTEAVVAWGRTPPAGPADPSARSTRLTNGRYAKDGGAARFPVDPPDGHPLHLAIFGCRRIGNELRIADSVGSSARRLVRDVATASVRYSVRRGGWRKRSLRIDVEAERPTPELLIVLREGRRAPSSRDDGRPLGRIPAATTGGSRRHELSLDAISFPAGVRVFAADASVPLVIHDPPIDELVLSD